MTKSGNISEIDENVEVRLFRIGDKVAYNEGTGKTSDIDSSFKMKDLEWRILDIEDDGTIELISTQPTDSVFYLPKEESAWLDYEEKLDKLCDDIYGKGIGAKKARSLKIEDINKIMGDDFNPSNYASLYGKYFWYKFDNTSGQIQYSKEYNEQTGIGTWQNTGYTSFKDPRDNIIDSNNYLDEKGQLRIKKLQHNYAYYNIEEKDLAKLRTRDGILMSQLITQGLDSSNTSASGTTQNQWLSSKYIDCTQKYVEYGTLRIAYGAISDRELWRSNGELSLSGSFYYVVRPVVVLDSNTDFNFVNNQWQISE